MSARGTVIKRGDRWAVVLDLGRDAAGKRIRRWHSGYESAKAAEKARTELLGALDGGNYVAPTKLTVRAFAAAEWLPSLDSAVAGGTLKPSTASNYRTLLEAHVLPEIGGVLLTELSAPRLNAFYGRLLVSGRRDGRGGLSRTSVRLVHVVCHRMLRDAVRWGRLARNVADQADAPTPERRRMSVWSPPQLRTFLDSVATHRLRALWLLVATTGLRRGEATGLTWADVDLDGARLSVSHSSVVVDHAVVTSSPKSSSSARTIGLDGATVRALRSHRAQQATERLAGGSAYAPSDLVFTWEDGRPLHPGIVTKTFERLARRAGLPPIRLHDVRHSYATAALEAGVPLKVVSERLGHSSIAITGDVYSHVRPEVDQAAADQIAALILGGGA
jgi:integrase